MIRYSFNILYLTLIFLIIIGLYWLTHQKRYFPIKTIKVSAPYQMVSKQNIEQALSPLVNTSFFSVNLNKITQTLTKFPGIQQVFISRTWPATLAIKINERWAIAQWPNGLLMDASGHFFKASAKTGTWQQLPKFSGDQKSWQRMTSIFEQLKTTLEPMNLSIANLSYNGANQLQVTLGNGLMLYFANQHFNQQLKRFAKVYPKLITDHPKRNLQYLNFHYVSGVAVRWK